MVADGTGLPCGVDVWDGGGAFGDGTDGACGTFPCLFLSISDGFCQSSLVTFSSGTGSFHWRTSCSSTWTSGVFAVGIKPIGSGTDFFFLGSFLILESKLAKRSSSSFFSFWAWGSPTTSFHLDAAEFAKALTKVPPPFSPTVVVFRWILWGNTLSLSLAVETAGCTGLGGGDGLTGGVGFETVGML